MSKRQPGYFNILRNIGHWTVHERATNEQVGSVLAEGWDGRVETIAAATWTAWLYTSDELKKVNLFPMTMCNAIAAVTKAYDNHKIALALATGPALSRFSQPPASLIKILRQIVGKSPTIYNDKINGGRTRSINIPRFKKEDYLKLSDQLEARGYRSIVATVNAWPGGTHHRLHVLVDYLKK